MLNSETVDLKGDFLLGFDEYVLLSHSEDYTGDFPSYDILIVNTNKNEIDTFLANVFYYDFEKVNISIDSLNRTVTLNELPQPEILSIDHDLDYYDISEGTFNSFTNEEYNMINRKAKELIASKAKNTPFLSTAEKQKSEYLKMMEMALQSAGWKLIIKGTKPVLD